MSFVHLHVHTQYSLLDGMNRIPALIQKVKKMGQTACAITDHGNMFGVIEFYKECKANDIKPIIGCEVYVAPYGTSRFDKSTKEKNNDWSDSKYNHLILIAKNNEGYKNLCKICSIGWTEGFYYKPRVDFETIQKYSSGIICASACLAGAIPQALLHGEYDLAKKIALEYQSVFHDDYYIELQDHGLKEQAQTNPHLIQIAREIGAKVIATNDAHYLNKEDAAIHDILLCVQTGKVLSDTNRLKFGSNEFYVKSEAEMRELFYYIPEAIDTTMEIADKCNVEFEFGNVKLPDYEIPEGYQSYDEYFRHICHEGMIKRYGEQCPQEYWDRLEYELSVIEKMNFVGYYLIVWDFINFAKTHDIPVGAGRGSGAGSIAAYASGITNIDPMKYDLLFERFLNPERISMPDFDTDFCYERRHEVIEYVTRKYGKDRVSQIVTFGTMAAKNSIRDVARVMEVPYAEADRLAKMIPSDPKITIDKAFEQNPEFQKEYDTNPQSKKIVDIARKLEGTPRQSSKHACGVLIADKDITEYAPLMTAENDETGEREAVIQFPMGTLEELGLVKMDFLGLRTLSVLKNACNEIQKRYTQKVDVGRIDPDNFPQIYEMMVNDSTIGIFQFESAGMVDMLRKMFYDVDRVHKCNTKAEKLALGHEFFERLIAGISLYRPGPMSYIPQYIDGLRNPENIKYDCKELEPILKNTYGVIVYQEQVMKIVQVLAGYSLGRADLIRRAMGKKKQKIMDAEKQIFLYGNKDTRKENEAYVPGCIANGISEEVALTVWDKMADFAKYAFNKSHAAAYAYLSVQTAVLRMYYPAEFMAATISSYIGNNSKLSYYINACQKTLGIKILNPDTNESNVVFTVLNGAIRFGLNGIKDVGGVLANAIVDERKNGKFTSFYDFCVRLSSKGLNKKAIEALIKSGAFDWTGYNRAELLNAYPRLIDFAKKAAAQHEAGQFSLFGSDTDDSDSEPEIQRSPDLSEDIKLKFEHDVTSIYISGNPLNKYSKAIQMAHCTTIHDIADDIANKVGKYRNRQNVRLGVILNKIERKVTKNGGSMIRGQIQDADSEAEIIAFSKAIEQCGSLFTENRIVLAHVSIDIKDDDSFVFIVNALYEMPRNDADEHEWKRFRREAFARR